MKNEYIVMEMKEKDDFIFKNANSYFSNFILNIYTEENLDIFKDWKDSVFDSIENFMTGVSVRDIFLITESGQIHGFKNAIPANVTIMVDGAIHSKISFNGRLDDDHPFIKQHNRKRKIALIRNGL
jgi:hypothetical protein